MYKGMKSLWDSCVIRREENICEHWPEECEYCVLVQFYLVKLPKCWNSIEMDFDSIDDKYQLAVLLHSHIIGSCGASCLFCEIERIPI